MPLQSKRIRGLILAAVVIAGSMARILPAGAAPARQSTESAAKWEADLRAAKEGIESRHPNAFHSLSRDEWDREFAALAGRLGSLRDDEIVVELARIVARLEDGHTRVTLPLGPGIDFQQGHSNTPDPKLPELRMHQYPVRFALDADGVYVQRIAAAQRNALGGRVVRLGRLPIAEALAAVGPTVEHDNEYQTRHHLPMHLVLAELLQARGVTETAERLEIELRMPGGRSRRIVLPVVPHGETVEWTDLRDAASAPLPLSLQHPDRKFWFAHLRDLDTMYLQFNEVYDEKDETLRDFAARVEDFIRDNGVENLVVDLRQNRGGNESLARPLLHAILRSRVDRTGHFYALIGRTTFSAAMMFALSLEKHTNVLFAGEPTGARPNHYGDSRKVLLPNSGITVRVSTLYHQYDPTDARTALPPHIPVDLREDDYRNNRDPVMDTVLEIIAAQRDTHAASSESLAGTWKGVTSPGLNSCAMQLRVSGAMPAPGIDVEIPDMELRAEAHDVAAATRPGGIALQFRADWQEQPLVFQTQAAGDWLIGEGLYASVRFPLVLRRVPGER